MLTMLRAHGLDPGPTQHPLAAGALAGVLAALPGLAVLRNFAWLAALGGLLGIAPALAGLLCAAGFTAAGTLYALILRRAANDPRGGWLFGLAFGFFLWMLVPLLLLQWLPAWLGAEPPAFIGSPAVGLLLSALVWGAALGALFPVVHRQLRGGHDREPPAHARLGPEAAAMPEIGRPPADAPRPAQAGAPAP